jgi:hypothetical protein
LGHYVGPGAVALVHDGRVKGSHVAAKTRFGVAWGMEGDVVTFKCPYNKNKFRSKSCTIAKLPSYVGFYQFSSMPQPKSKNPSSHMKIKDFKTLTEEKSHSVTPTKHARMEKRWTERYKVYGEN